MREHQGKSVKPKSRRSQKTKRARRVLIRKMTICRSWYDAEEKGAKSYELHFTVARRGKIRTVRRTLARRGVEFFRQSFHRRFGKWIPRSRVKVGFEREEPAPRSEKSIRIEGSIMFYRGRRWWAKPLAQRYLSYVKKRRKRRVRR